jgi:hypothetical protein
MYIYKFSSFINFLIIFWSAGRDSAFAVMWTIRWTLATGLWATVQVVTDDPGMDRKQLLFFLLRYPGSHV